MALGLCYFDAIALRGLSLESMKEISLALGGLAVESTGCFFDFPDISIDQERLSSSKQATRCRVTGNVRVRSLSAFDIYPRHVVLVTMASTVVYNRDGEDSYALSIGDYTTPGSVAGTAKLSKHLDEESWLSLAKNTAIACSSGKVDDDTLSLRRICRERNAKIARAARGRGATIVVDARSMGGLCLADRPYMNGSVIGDDVSSADSFERLQMSAKEAIVQQLVVKFVKNKLRGFRQDRRFLDSIFPDQMSKVHSGRDVSQALVELQIEMRQLSEMSYQYLGRQTPTLAALNRHLGTDIELSLLPIRIGELNDEIGLRLLAILSRELGSMWETLASSRDED